MEPIYLNKNVHIEWNGNSSVKIMLENNVNEGLSINLSNVQFDHGSYKISCDIELASLDAGYCQTDDMSTFKTKAVFGEEFDANEDSGYEDDDEEIEEDNRYTATTHSIESTMQQKIEFLSKQLLNKQSNTNL